MLDFIWTLPVQLWGTRNKWTLQKIHIHGRIRTTNSGTSCFPACPSNHSATETVDDLILELLQYLLTLRHYKNSDNIKSSTVSVAEWLEGHAGKQEVPELVVRILPWIWIFCNVHLFRVPHSWTGSVQMKSSMTFIRVYMCIEREKATFNSREVNV